ncbi:hypothetical protein [Sinosporangium siamense]|uniref:Uncharacterized protein n=1 Tax=Sinosporangium siamense TaxID=1367973 RepID=A0A919RMF7_9ACTN|nr:hypothetical protein [Sinosporangium siamense]GII96486.1 hypothetical protein Ssi02_67170 [Sinosporangium siamense]
MGCLDEYDGIILGAGHNGLITQAYLSRAGLKTLSSAAARSRARSLLDRAFGRTKGTALPNAPSVS